MHGDLEISESLHTLIGHPFDINFKYLVAFSLAENRLYLPTSLKMSAVFCFS